MTYAAANTATCARCGAVRLCRAVRDADDAPTGLSVCWPAWCGGTGIASVDDAALLAGLA